MILSHLRFTNAVFRLSTSWRGARNPSEFAVVRGFYEERVTLDETQVPSGHSFFLGFKWRP